MHSLGELEQGSHSRRKAQHFLPSRSLFLASRACSSPRAAACSFGHLQLFAVVVDGLLQQRMTGSKQYLARYSPGMQFPTRHKPPSWLQLSGPCVCPVERSRKVVGKCLSWQGGKIKVGGASQGTVCLAKPMLGVCMEPDVQDCSKHSQDPHLNINCSLKKGRNILLEDPKIEPRAEGISGDSLASLLCIVPYLHYPRGLNFTSYHFTPYLIQKPEDTFPPQYLSHFDLITQQGKLFFLFPDTFAYHPQPAWSYRERSGR